MNWWRIPVPASLVARGVSRFARLAQLRRPAIMYPSDRKALRGLRAMRSRVPYRRSELTRSHRPMR